MRNHFYKIIFVLAVCATLGLFVSTWASAQTTYNISYYVSPTGDDSSSCLFPGTPCQTIQHVIDVADGAETGPVTIHVAAGTYNEHLVMDSWESLEGGWNRDFSQQWDFENDGLEPDIEYHTVIDGGNNGRCITLESTGDTNMITGFTIQNVYADRGGGMYNVRSSPSVSHCRFYHNWAVSDGAGMYNLNSSPAIFDCAFSENIVTGTMSHGGGMYNASSSPNITNCDFSKNQSGGWGGGIYNYYSPSKISNCTFSQNNAGKTGGGMVNSHGNPPPIVSNCIFSENTAVSGGGMRNTWCRPIVTNCIFWGNTAPIEGGGIFNLFDSPVITNCTFSENNSGKGGAISHRGQDNQPYAPIITNCILWGNTGGEIYINAYSFPIVTYCNIDQDGYAGQNGNIRANPLFVGLKMTIIT